MSDTLIKPFSRRQHEFIMRDPSLDKRYTILVGSVRSGKTISLSVKQIAQLCRYKLPANAKRLMIGATRQTLYRNVLLDLETMAGGSRNFSYNQSSGEMWLFGTQWWCVGGKDESSYKNILGTTVGLVVGDEAIEYPESFMAQLFMRMSFKEARAYFTTNPGSPYAYLKASVIDNPAFKDTLEVIPMMLTENPNIDADAKAAIIASQTGVFRERYIEGKWVVASGSIYRDAFSEVHNLFDGEVVVDGRHIKLQDEPAWLRRTGSGSAERWIAVDAGVDHVQTHQEFYDTGDVIYVTREQRWDSRVMNRQKTDAEYVSDLIDFGALSCMTIIPPEAASLRAEAVSRGLWVMPADNAVSEGIHTVSSLLARRKLLISQRGCPELSRRILSYAWDPNAAKLGKEQPLKQNDDDVDCLRYGVHGKIPQWRITGA